WFLKPLLDAAQQRIGEEGRAPGFGDPNVARLPPITGDGVYGDVVAVATTEVRLFVSADNAMRVWRGSGKPDEKQLFYLWRTTWTKTEEERFAVPFDEPFMTYVVDRDYWFATESGKLYRAHVEG